MKKIFAMIIAIAMLSMAVPASANYNFFDFKYNYEYVMIKLPNGEIVSGKCEEWTDYESDAVQVRVNGVTYLTHYVNVVLMSGVKSIYPARAGTWQVLEEHADGIR